MKFSNSLLSRLTEFQAIFFSQKLKILGIPFETSYSPPSLDNKEIDEALGLLADIPDPTILVSEGAPSILLPKQAKDILLITGELLPGYLVINALGVVNAHRSAPRRVFREEELSLLMENQMKRAQSTVPNTWLAKSVSQSLFQDLFLDLQKKAMALGANSVLSVQIQFFSETNQMDPSSDQLRIVALGTAAVVEKA